MRIEKLEVIGGYGRRTRKRNFIFNGMSYGDEVIRTVIVNKKKKKL